MANKKKISDELVKNACEYYFKCKSVRQTAKFFNVKYTSLWRRIKNIGINTSMDVNAQRKRRIKFEINESYFESIDNNNKAYTLGFLYADGYMAKSRKQVRLKICDYDIVRKIADKMGITKTLYKRNYKEKKSHKDQWELRICNTKIYDDLIKLGCYQQKTFNCLFPNNTIVSNDFMPDFIRGYFDGDGCIYVSRDLNKAEVRIIGTNEFCQGLKDFLTTNAINSYLDKDKKCDKRISILRIRYKDGINKFFSLMYKNIENLFLERKYNKFKTFSHLIL